MADNDSYQNSVNNVDNITEKELVEKERTLKAVIDVLNTSKEINHSFSKKQGILHRLYQEQLVTSNNFKGMNLLKIGFLESIASNIDAFRRFKEIDDEAKLILTLLKDFEEKLHQSGVIARNFNANMRVHLAKLRKQLNTVTEDAKTVQDMAEMDVPNLEWCTTIPDLEVEALADHWDQMRLKPRTTKLLNELMHLIHGNL